MIGVSAVHGADRVAEIWQVRARYKGNKCSVIIFLSTQVVRQANYFIDKTPFSNSCPLSEVEAPLS